MSSVLTKRVRPELDLRGEIHWHEIKHSNGNEKIGIQSKRVDQVPKKFYVNYSSSFNPSDNMHVVLPLAHSKPNESGGESDGSSSGDSELIPSEVDPPEVSVPRGLISVGQLKKIIS